MKLLNVKITRFLKKLGPGLLLLEHNCVSHLVQSTKAGAFGFGLVWALIIAIILKYPFLSMPPYIVYQQENLFAWI